LLPSTAAATPLELGKKPARAEEGDAEAEGGDAGARERATRAEEEEVVGTREEEDHNSWTSRDGEEGAYQRWGTRWLTAHAQRGLRRKR